MKDILEEFKSLLEVSQCLMDPVNGCPWDIEQSLESLRPTILEEAYEVIEAINLKDDHNLQEELGDLLYNIIFLAKIAENLNKFSLKDVLFTIKEKLILRHPHVFAEESLKTAEEVLDQWERIKSKEKSHRKSALEGIPMDLPSLLKGYKIIGKFKKTNFSESSENKKLELSFQTEEELGELIWSIIEQARETGINPEMALQAIISKKERSFLAWESKI